MKIMIRKSSLLVIAAFSALAVGSAHSAVLAGFAFPADNSLIATTKAANLTVSDVALSSSTITTNVTTGSAFPNEPFIQGTGWTATTQATAKNFFFTITADTGYTFAVTSVSFLALATGTGPSALGFTVGTASYNQDMPSASLVLVDQVVSGQTGLTTTTFRIQGWLNSSRTSNGAGDLRIDDLTINGTVIPEPSTTLLGGLGLLALFRRRR